MYMQPGWLKHAMFSLDKTHCEADETHHSTWILTTPDAWMRMPDGSAGDR